MGTSTNKKPLPKDTICSLIDAAHGLAARDLAALLQAADELYAFHLRNLKYNLDHNQASIVSSIDTCVKLYVEAMKKSMNADAMLTTKTDRPGHQTGTSPEKSAQTGSGDKEMAWIQASIHKYFQPLFASQDRLDQFLALMDHLTNYVRNTQLSSVRPVVVMMKILFHATQHQTRLDRDRSTQPTEPSVLSWPNIVQSIESTQMRSEAQGLSKNIRKWGRMFGTVMPRKVRWLSEVPHESRREQVKQADGPASQGESKKRRRPRLVQADSLNAACRDLIQLLDAVTPVAAPLHECWTCQRRRMGVVM